ncbi:MAG: hypothetical protein H6525_10845 [Actinobacteria bacterium]|nr:hypothetical protein [Actinomycetota bacterium]
MGTENGAIPEVHWSIGFTGKMALIRRRIGEHDRIFATIADNVTFTVLRAGTRIAEGAVIVDEADGRLVISEYSVRFPESNPDILCADFLRSLTEGAARKLLVETQINGGEIKIPEGLTRSLGRAGLPAAIASGFQRKERPRLSDELLREVHSVYASAEDRARLTAVRKHFGITQSRAQNWVAASRKRLPELWEVSR